jgi:transcription initiation factor TFIID subunit TAF12
MNAGQIASVCTTKSHALTNARGILTESLQGIPQMNGRHHADDKQGMQRHKTQDEYQKSPTQRFEHGTPTRLRTLL